MKDLEKLKEKHFTIAKMYREKIREGKLILKVKRNNFEMNTISERWDEDGWDVISEDHPRKLEIGEICLLEQIQVPFEKYIEKDIAEGIKDIETIKHEIETPSPLELYNIGYSDDVDILHLDDIKDLESIVEFRGRLNDVYDDHKRDIKDSESVKEYKKRMNDIYDESKKALRTHIDFADLNMDNFDIMGVVK